MQTQLFEIGDTLIKKFQQNENDVETLKNWIKSQPHLPEILDDKSVGNFLLLNKCSIERAKQSIDMYYTLRTKISDVYESSNPKCGNILAVLEMLYWIPLPKLTEANYRILVFKIRDKTFSEKINPCDLTRLALDVQEIRLKEDVMVGDVVIYDMEGVNFNYILKLTPSIIAKVYTIYDKVYSIPLKGLYIVNSPPFANSLLSILKRVMKPKVYERVHVCSDISILGKSFPKNVLPKDYGGDEKSLEELNEILKFKLRQYQDRFDQLDTLRVDESLRPEKLENDEILGFHGNFKKLEVD